MKRFLLVPASLLLFTIITFAQNNSLQFNGNAFTGPYVNVSTNSDDFNFGNTFTLEAWVYPTAGSNGNQTIVSKGGGNGGIDNSYIFQIQSGTLQFYNAASTASPYWFNTGVPIPNNVWTYVAVTYSNPTLKVFVNGSLMYTQSVVLNMNPGTNDFYIGRQGNSCLCNKFYGQIDEVRVWNIARSNTEIYKSFNKDLTGTEAGLVAYYQFNQGSANGTNTGVTTLTDIAGTPNTGTLNSFALTGTLSNWVNGVQYLNNALNFDGVNDIVDVPYNSQLSLNANPFTIEYWARPTAVDGTNHWVLNKGTGNSDVDYLVGLTSNNKFTFISRNLNVYFSGSTVAVAGNWYHVANVFDGTSAKVYVNGVLEATSTTLGTASTNTTGLRIGARTEFGVPTQYFTGDIDEIRIWNIALSQNEIQNNRSKNVTFTTPGLVAYYEFNQGVPAGTNTAINTAIDDSGNNFTGALTNFGLTGTSSNWVSSTSTSTTGSFTFDPPAITGISPSLTVCSGFTTTVAVTATGSLLSYQWYANGSPIPGQTSATLTISGSLATASGTLFAVVSRGVTSVTSSGISLTVGCNNALDFDGVNDFVSFPTNFSGSPSSQVTIEAWVNPTNITTNTYYDVFRSSLGTPPLLFSFQNNGSILSFGTSLSGSYSELDVSISAANYVGQWVHIAATYDGQTKRVYRNGVLIGSVTATGIIDPASLCIIGRDGTLSTSFYNGKMDEARIWNVAVSQADIQANMFRTVSNTTPGLVVYYDFNQGVTAGNNTSVSSLADRSGNSVNGSFSGFSLTGSNSNLVASTVTITTTSPYVFSAPVIVGLSPTATLCSGFVSTLTVTISGGSGATYQWSKDGVSLAGATTSSFNLTGALTTIPGVYTVAINSLGGNLTSSGINIGFQNCISNALNFSRVNNSVGNYVAVPHSTSINLGANYTIEAWVYYNGNDVTIIDKGNYDFAFQLGNASDGGRLAMYSTANSGWYKSSSFVPQNTWTHVAVAIGGGGGAFYINGVASGTFSWPSLSQDTGPMNIGRQSPSTCLCNPFSGSMDELRIWNTTRTALEISSNMNSIIPTTTTGLGAYYRFDQGIPSGNNAGLATLFDLSPNANHGTLLSSGAAWTLNGALSNWVAGAPISGSTSYNPPVITGITTTQTVCSGVTLPLSVTASGFVYAYQWRKDGVDILGATTSTLTISGVTVTSAGVYSVSIRSLGGDITSPGISIGVGCNNALDFDGSSDYVRIPSGFPSLSELTIEAWIFPRVSGGIHRILSFDNSTAGALQFYLTTGGMAFSMSGNTPSEFRFGTFPVNNDYHIAAVYSAMEKTVKFYINGVLSFTGNYSTAINSSASTPFQVGCWFSGINNNFFNGRIDELRVWNTALSDADIQANYNKTANVVYPGLLLNYDFNQGVTGGNNAGQTTVLDKSGNAYNGTLNTFALTGASSNWVASSAPIAGNTLTFSSPSILGLSSSQTVCSGITVPLSVTASGSGLGYQWRKDGVNILGAIASTLTLTGVTSSSAGIYTVVVTSLGGNLTSSGVSLGVGCNNALDLNGALDYVNITNMAPYSSITNQFTYEAWIYHSGVVASKAFLIANNSFSFQWNATGDGTMDGYLVLNPGGGFHTYSTGAIPANTWTHLAYTYNKGQYNFYINGLPAGAGVIANSTLVTPAQIGFGDNPQVVGNVNLSSTIDEVKIWNIALSPIDIQNNYTKKPNSTTPGLVAYYDFDQGIPNGVNTGLTSVLDRSANSNNGVFTNGALSGSTSNWVVSGATISGSFAFATPSIVGISPSSTICSGVTTTFSLTATGTNLSYQWYKNGLAISGQTFSTLTLTSGLTTSAGTIIAVVTNNSGSVTSTGISLGVGCNNALDFDGVDDFVQLPPATYFPNNNYTVETWVYPRSLADQSRVLDFGNGPYAQNVFITLTAGTNQPPGLGIYPTTSGAQYIGVGNLTLNTWTHLAVVSSGTNAYLYINGVLNQSFTGVISVDNIVRSLSYIGKSNWANAYTNGILDELRIWNTSVSQVDINNNKNRKPVGNEPGLVAYYDFDQGIASGDNSTLNTLIDRTSNNYTGTLTGFSKSGNGSNFVTSGISINGIYIIGVPTITGISSSSTVCSGVVTNLTVTAVGSNLAYQWYKNGSAMAGQTFATLTLSSGLTTSPGTIFAVVSNSSGSVTSTGISLGIGCNNALSFDGAKDYVTINGGSTFPSNDFTFETWVRTSSSGNQVLLGNSNGFGYYLSLAATNKARFLIGSDPMVESFSNLNDGNWHHLAISRSQNQLNLYFDGILESTATSSTALPVTGNTELGRYASSFYSKFDMDELRIWNIALSQVDIQNNRFKNLSTTTLGLVGYYDANQGTPSGANNGITDLVDRSGKAINGTLTNFNLSGSISNWISSSATITATGPFIFAAPVISAISPSLTVCSGFLTSVSVTASGTNLSYQWYKNGSAIAGQTFSTLTLSSGLTTSSGNIFAVVSNSGGTVTSTGISLTVNNCNNALNFDGSGDLVNLGLPASLNFTNSSQFTIQYWFRTNGGGQVAILSSLPSSGLATGYEAYLFNGKVGLAFSNNAGASNHFYVNSANAYNDGRWHQASIVYNGSSDANQVVFYVDGNLEKNEISVNSLTLPITNNTIYVGSRQGNLMYSGDLDELRIYNAQLNQAVVRASLTSTLTGLEANLLAYYDFNAGNPNGNNAGQTILPNRSATAGLDGSLAGFALNGSSSNWVNSQVPVQYIPTVVGFSSSLSVCPNTTQILSIIASGTSMDYQWYRNGVPQAGQTLSTLTLTGVQASSSGTYFAVVQGSVGTATSTGITLNVLSTPGFAVQPISATICGGNSHVFSAIATGSGLTYLWSNGAITPSITVSGIGNYTATVSGTCGTAVSNTVSLSTISGTTILSQPTSATICGGNSNVFSVSAIGSGLTYLWSNGATTPSITVSGIGSYTATVSGTCGTAISNTVSLSTLSGTTITTQPTSATICGGNTKIFSVSATGSGLTYLWSNGAITPSITVSGIGNYTATVSGTCGTAISNTVSLSTISGTTILSQPTSATICGGNSNVFSVSAIGSGLTYLWSNGAITPSITVSGIGNYTATVSGTCGTAVSNTVSLSTLSGTTITTQPTSATICGGNTKIFSVSATGSGLTYLWSNGAITPSITVSGIGNYTATVSGTCGTAISNTVSLSTISGTTITTQPTSATICGGNINVFSVSAAGSSLTYLWSNGATTPSITVSGIGNYTATVSGTCGTAISNTVSLSTISGTTITTQTTSATICGGNTNVFSVSAAGSGLTYLWSNGATTQNITVSGIGSYTVTVSGTCGTVISNTVSLSTLSGTTITAQPTSATICGGSFTTLSIAGSGNNIIYQWNTGANSSSIIVSTAGLYQATVSGTCGLVVSNPINIAIENPVIGINATSTLIGLGQSVVLSGTGAVTYTFTGGVINGIGFAPSATNTYSVAGATLNGCIGKSDITITVTVAGTNIVSITPSITTCLGSTIKMVVSATGNNLFYDWYYNNSLYMSGPFANNLTIPSLSTGNSGTYFVVVSGSNGTVTSSSINIGVQDPTVSATISPNVVCLGSVVTLAGNGALTYTVSGGVQEGIGFVPAATSTYTVTGADNLGCKATTLVTVTVFGLPLVGVVTPSTEICYGNTISLGGTGALTYSWSNGIIDGAFFTPTISGVYTVTGIDGNGCSNQSTSQVTVNALPSVSINASSNVVCAGSEVTLSGIGALTYSWSGGVSNGVGFIPSATATYSVTGIDGNLCSNSAITTINVVSTPTVSGFSSSNNICIGQTITLTGAGAQTYSWSNGVSDGVSFAPSATNIYTVTGIAPGGCFSTSTVQVVVNPLPTVSGLAVPSILCIGGQTTLTGSGAITYSWSNGVLNDIGFTPTVSGIYTVTGIDGNACSQTAQVPVTVNPLPSVGINASSSVVCAGNQVTLAGTGALTYNWSGGVSNNIGFTPINSNAYTVSGTDLNGCVNYATTTVSVSPPVVLGQLTTTSIGYGQPISEVLTASGIGPFTYSISNGTLPNGIALDAVTGTFTGFASLIGNYSFTVAVTNGSCGNSKPFSIQVTKGNLTVQVLDTSIYGSQPTPISFLSSVTGLRPSETLNYVYNTSAPANNAPFGDYPISVIVSGSTLVNYNLTVNGGTLHVLPLIGLTVTASNFTREYGQPNPIFTSTIVGLNPNDRVTISYITSANSLSGLSTYPIYPQVSGLDAYKYSKTLIPGNLTIKAARLTIKASDAYLVAGSVIPATFPGIVTGLVPGDDITVRNTVDITTSTVLGVYQITPEVEGTSLNNYTLIMFPGNLYIKYGLTVAAMNFTRNYGQSNPTYSGTVTGIQPNGTGVTVRYTSGVIGSTPIGSYTIDPKVSGSDADKYVVTTISGVYTIFPAPLTVAANNFVKLQGDPNPVFASTVYGLINGESLFINYFTSADQTSPAGQYSVIPDPSGTTLSNYNLTTVAGVLTIGTTTSNLSVTVGNYSRVYGDPDPAITGSVNGLKSGDDVQVSFTSNTNASSPVGIYPISINITGTDITKYTISTVAGTLTITSAPLTISANSYSKAYMDTIPTLSGSIVGLKNGENLTITYQTGASQISNVGNYPVVPSVPTSSILSNYKLTVNNGALAITKVNLTVIGANLSRPFGQNNPQLSYNLLGFVNGENITVIDKIPEGQTIAQSNSSTGTYTITYFGGVDNNYDFTYGTGILTVAKASQTILVASLNANVSTGNTLGVTALASSGLPLSLTSLDTTIVKVVNGLQILGVADGSTSLIVSQSGNANYDAAPSITITGISTSTGVVAPSVIGVIGSNEVVPNSPVTYSMPYKVGYTYLWVYTGTNINWLESKKDSNVVKVLFTQVTATNVGGQMIGKMFDPQGNLVKTDSIPIAINTSEDAQIAAILSQQLAPVKCAPVITDCANAYILSFNLGKRVRNKSGCSQSGFGDYTTFGKVDTLIMGASYQLKASAINTKSAASFFAIWIDYGNDGSFEDPDDFVRASFKTDSVFEVNNVIIRNNDDYIGPRRVRVSMRTSGAFVQSQSCPEEGTVGETEDYLIYIRKQDALEAPSAITPNDDGKNDLFIVRGVNPKLDNKLTILDRLGKKVFEQKDYQNDWGGKDSDGNKLEDGTYFYFFTNGNVQIRGFVEIKTR